MSLILFFFFFFLRPRAVSLLLPLVPALGYEASCLHCLWGGYHGSCPCGDSSTTVPGLLGVPKWLCYLLVHPFVNLCTNKQSDNLNTSFYYCGNRAFREKKVCKTRPRCLLYLPEDGSGRTNFRHLHELLESICFSLSGSIAVVFLLELRFHQSPQ